MQYKKLIGLGGREVEPVRVETGNVVITPGRSVPQTFTQHQPSKPKGATTMNASNMTRTEAGNELDRLTKEYMEQKDVDYQTAFDRVAKATPAMLNAYIPAAGKRAG